MEVLILLATIYVVGFVISICADNSNNKSYPNNHSKQSNVIENNSIKDVNFQKCRELIDNGNNIFITGGAGVGKSTLLKKLLKHYPNIELTSTTGISAYNIGGETIHSFLGVGICNKTLYQLIKSTRKNTALFEKLKTCKIIAIDEISMLGFKQFEYMDSFLKKIRNNNLPFGGIQVIVVGDFFQLPPVKDDFVFINNNALWQSFEFQPIILDKIWRQKDLEFIKNLNKIRVGNIDNELLEFFASNIKPKNSKYDNITHFYTHKVDVNKFNKEQLNKNTNPEQIFYSNDYTATWNEQENEYILNQELHLSSKFDEDNKISCNKNYDDEKCYELSKNTLSRHKLVLKMGCKVLITKNLTNEIVNGTIGTFIKVEENNLIIDIKGKKYSIDKAQFEIKKSGEEKSIVRKQYPVILAYALTIHKAQGLTLEKAVIDITNSFTFGQVYVAMSRVIEKDNLIILNNLPINKILASPDVIDFYRYL